MADWKQQFDEHPVHSALEDVQRLAAEDTKSIGADTKQARRRFKKILQRIETGLANVDPEMLDFSALQSVDDLLRGGEVLGALNIYEEQGGEAPYKNASDRLLKSVSNLPELMNAASSKSKVPPNAVIESEVDALNKQLESLAGDIVDASVDNRAKLSDTDARIKTLSSRIDQLEADVTAKKSELDALHGQQAQKFSEQESGRSSTFSTFMSESQSRADELITATAAELEKRTEKLRQATEQKLSEIHTDASAWHSEIRALYGLVANDAVAAGYTKTAMDEKSAANFWRWATVAFILATGAWLLLSALGIVGTVRNPPFEAGPEPSASQSVFTLSGVLSKKFFASLALVSILLFGAAFSAQQSAKHRKYEQRARKFALEMGALNPFLDSLDDESKREIKKKLSERIFGRDDGDSGGTDAIHQHSHINILLETIREMSGKLR